MGNYIRDINGNYIWVDDSGKQKQVTNGGTIASNAGTKKQAVARQAASQKQKEIKKAEERESFNTRNEVGKMVVTGVHQDPITKEIITDEGFDRTRVGGGGLSGYDPLLGTAVEWIVGGKMLGDVWKGIQYGLGRYGTPAIKNWAKGRLIGQEFNRSPILVPTIEEAYLNIGKTPVQNFTTAKSIYTGGAPIEDVLQGTKEGLSEVYKTYSPRGAWYERQLANGISEDQVKKESEALLKNLRSSTFEFGAIDGDAVATTAGAINKEGQVFTIIKVDPTQIPNKPLTKEAIIHEGGHASVLNYEPVGSEFRLPQHEKYYQLVEKDNPEIVRMMEHNLKIRPEVREDALDEILASDKGMRHYKNVGSDDEIRQRAFAAEVDAYSKGMTLEQYYNTPSAWNTNMKQLSEIFTPESLKQYLKYYKSYGIPLTIGAGYVSKQKQGGKFKYYIPKKSDSLI